MDVALLARMSPSSNQQNLVKYETKVVVVGAGLAGLAAAERLASSGIDTLLVEAQDRIGGRVQSIVLPCAYENCCTSDKHYVELGATWFHGTVGNSAYDIAVSEKLISVDETASVLEQEPDEDPGSVLHSSSVLFTTPAVCFNSDGTVSELHLDEVLPTVVKYTRAASQLKNEDDQIMSNDVFKTAIESTCEYSSLNKKERAAFRARDLLECSINGCATTASLSARLDKQYTNLAGDNIRMSGRGMSALAQTLFKQASQSGSTFKFLSCAPVVVVDVPAKRRDDTPRARVVLESGDVISADAVIWTPSVNATIEAVKNGVFRPNLSQEKSSALHDRGMDNVEQVHAVLSRKPVGVMDGVSIPVLWDEELVGIGCRKNNGIFTWEVGVFCIYFDEHCNCASMWLSGRHAENFSKLSEDERRVRMERLLSKVYKQAVTVATLIQSHWFSNKFIKGSYSYPRAGSADDAAKTLSSPVIAQDVFPTLCFAGEATHSSFYSTMHGAIDSGRREADRLLQVFAQA